MTNEFEAFTKANNIIDEARHKMDDLALTEYEKDIIKSSLLWVEIQTVLRLRDERIEKIKRELAREEEIRKALEVKDATADKP